MPQVTVYIRTKDLEKWKAIEKKSEFIHNALNDGFKPKMVIKSVSTKPKSPEVTYKKTGSWGA